MKGIAEVLDEIRNRINGLEIDQTIDVSLNSCTEALEIWLKNKEQNNLRRVINATGIVVHTNLGRSSLAGQVQKDLLEVAMNYSTLEFDLNNGKRGVVMTMWKVLSVNSQVPKLPWSLTTTLLLLCWS